MSVDILDNPIVDTAFGDPEELRQQAVEEKSKFRTLKAEGKSEEALKAFKRGKELERQAGALEIAIRKNRRMALKASNLSTVAGIQETDGHEESAGKQKVPSRRGKEAKDDLSSELRDLGWSDADLHDADKKPAKLSLEGELSNILAEVTQKSSQDGKKGGVDKSEVIALKKKALLLKREGKLAEAKEELKRAKILEKKIEEQELLGEAEESDDELSAIIKSMDEDKRDELSFDNASDAGFKYNNFLDFSDDIPIDGNFEVTDDDMNDPDLAAALKSFGWSEEDEEQVTSQIEHSGPVDREALRSQVLSLKREALNQKRAGNVSRAMELLRKSKLLEKELESMQSNSEIFASESEQKSLSTQIHVAAMQTIEEEIVAETVSSHFKLPPRSKLMIQKELLALKKRALTLRRERRIDEAEEELKKEKVLEQQLEEMENASKMSALRAGRKNLESTCIHEGGIAGSLDLKEEGFETEVTEQDLCDPGLLSLLKNLGWNEDGDVESVSMTNRTTKQLNDLSTYDTDPSLAPLKAKRSKADIQKELLAIKRKSLALRRQGKTEEAEEELVKAKALENQMSEMEVSSNANLMEADSLGSRTLIPEKITGKEQASNDAQKTAGILASVAVKLPKDEVVLLQDVSDISLMVKSDKTKAPEAYAAVPKMSQIETQMLGQSVLPAEDISMGSCILHQSSPSDDKAVHSSMNEPVKREDTDAKVSSVTSAAMKPGVHITSKEKTSSEGSNVSHTTSDFQVFQSKQTNVTQINSLAAPEQKLAGGVDALRDEVLAHKRKAVALKREGKLAEAREELRKAKLLEKILEDGQQADVVKEDASTSTFDNTALKQENKTSPSEKPKSGRDRFRIQQGSLSHKRNALKLRREGKIDEAEAELELAKALEKQLEEFDQGSSSKLEAMEDVVVEDLLDPQLMSALKAIGLEDTVIASQPYKKTESQPKFNQSGVHHMEKADLEEQIKAEKLRALNYKRAGKQVEALEALRSAKRLEKKLASLT